MKSISPPNSGFILVVDCDGDPKEVYSHSCVIDEVMRRCQVLDGEDRRVSFIKPDIIFFIPGFIDTPIIVPHCLVPYGCPIHILFLFHHDSDQPVIWF